MAWGAPAVAGNGQNKASSTLVQTVLSVNVAVGDVVIVLIAADNTSTTDGDNGEVSSVTDSKGNTYTKAREFTNGQGAAAAGATVSVWFSKLTTALVQSTDTVSGNFGTARIAKAISLLTATVGAGVTVSVAAGTDLANDAADPGSMDLTPPNVEHLWIRATALERAVAAWTKTVAYELNATAEGTTGGGAASNINICGEVDRLTGTTNASNPTATAVDCASVLVALLEAAGTQFTQSLTASMSTFGGSIVKQANKALSASMSTFSATNTKQANKVLSSSMSTFDGTLIKQTNHILSASMSTFSATLAASIVFVKDLSASMSTFAATIVKRTNKTLDASMSTFSGATSKQTNKLLPADMSTFSGTLAKRTSRALDASMSTFSAVLTEAVIFGRTLNASMATFAGALATLFIPSSPPSGFLSWVGPTVRSFLKRGSA